MAYFASGMLASLVIAAGTALPFESVTFMLTVYFTPGVSPEIGHAGSAQVTMTDFPPDPAALAL